MTTPYITLKDVDEIADREDPVIRNLQITQSYFDISTACRASLSSNANWCTFASWASQQAGRTIRGEDLIDNLKRRALLATPVLNIAEKVGRWFVRKGLFDPETRLGRLATSIHGPLDGLEAASRNIALGNKKVFEEIGREFARFLATCSADVSYNEAGIAAFVTALRPGPPPEGQDNLRAAFTNYYRAKFETDAEARAQLEYLGNVQIGFHEQIRLQQQIETGMTDPVVDEVAWGVKLAAALFPSSVVWWAWARNGLGAVLRVTLRPARKRILALVRAVVTEHMMTLTIAGRVFVLSQDIELPVSSLLQDLTDPDLMKLMSSVPSPAGGTAGVRAHDWADLGQRMRYIAYLFRVYHQRPEAFESPFSSAQVSALRAGRVPDGAL